MDGHGNAGELRKTIAQEKYGITAGNAQECRGAGSAGHENSLPMLDSGVRESFFVDAIELPEDRHASAEHKDEGSGEDEIQERLRLGGDCEASRRVNDNTDEQRHAVPRKGTHKRQIHIRWNPARVMWLHPCFSCAARPYCEPFKN